MPAAVVRYHAIATLAEEQHLPVPVVSSQGPAVAENYGLSLSPILVLNLRSVFCRDCRHGMLSLILVCSMCPASFQEFPVGFESGQLYSRLARLRHSERWLGSPAG